MSSNDSVSSDTDTNSSETNVATSSARSRSKKSASDRSNKSSRKTSTRSRSAKSRRLSRNRSTSQKTSDAPDNARRRTVLEITIVNRRTRSASPRSRRNSAHVERPRAKSSSPRYSDKKSVLERSSSKSTTSTSTKSRSSSRSRSDITSKSKCSTRSKWKLKAVRGKKSKRSAKRSSRNSRSSTRSRSKPRSNRSSTRSRSKSKSKAISRKGRRSDSKMRSSKMKNKRSGRRRKIEDSAKERLRRKSGTKSSFPGRKVTFASECERSHKRRVNSKKNMRSARSTSSKTSSASRSRPKIRAKIASRRSTSREVSKKKNSVVTSSIKSRTNRSLKNSSKRPSSTHSLSVFLSSPSNRPPRSSRRRSKDPKNDRATDVSSIDVFPATVSVRRPSGSEKIFHFKSSKVLEMKAPFVVYNSSSIDVSPSTRQLLIQTAVLICDHDKTYLEENAKAKQVMDMSTEENGVVLEESRVHLTRADGMVLIQRTSIVNNYWENADKVKTFHFQPFKFNVVRLNGSGKPSGDLQIHLMHGVRAERGQLSRREAVVVNFGDEAFIQEESESLRKVMRENKAVETGREHERGFSFFEETLDGAQTISVSREMGISGEIWMAGKRTEKIEDMKICCGGQETPLEQSNITRASSSTSVEMPPANVPKLSPKTQKPSTLPPSARIQLSPDQMQQLVQMLAKQISPPQVTPIAPALKTPSVAQVQTTPLEQPRKEQPSPLIAPTPTITPILAKLPSTTTAKKEVPQPVKTESKTEAPTAKPTEEKPSTTDDKPKKKVCLACKNAKEAQAKAKKSETAGQPSTPVIVAKVPSNATAKEISKPVMPPSPKKDKVPTSSSSSSAATSSAGSLRRRKREGCNPCKEAAESQAKFKKRGDSKKSSASLKSEKSTKAATPKTESSAPAIVAKVPSASTAKEIPQEKKPQSTPKTETSTKSETTKKRGASMKSASLKSTKSTKAATPKTESSVLEIVANLLSASTAKGIPQEKTPQSAPKTESSTKSETTKTSSASNKSGKRASLSKKPRKVATKSVKKTSGSVKAVVPKKESDITTAKEISAKINPIVAKISSKKNFNLNTQEKEKLMHSWADTEQLIPYIPPPTPPPPKTSSTTDSQKSTSGKRSKWSARTKPLNVARKAMSQMKKQKKPKTIGKRGFRECEELKLAAEEEKFWKELEKEGLETPPKDKVSSTKTTEEKPRDEEKPKTPTASAASTGTLASFLSYVLPSPSIPSQTIKETPAKTPSQPPKTSSVRSQKSSTKSTRGLQDCGKAHRQAQVKYRIVDAAKTATKPIVANQPKQKVPEKTPSKMESSKKEQKKVPERTPSKTDSSKREQAVPSETPKKPPMSDVKSKRSVRKVTVEKASEVEVSVEMVGSKTPPKKEIPTEPSKSPATSNTAKTLLGDQLSQKTPSKPDLVKNEAPSVKNFVTKKEVKAEVSKSTSSDSKESSFSESKKVAKVDSLMKYRKPRSAKKKKTEESSKLDKETPSKPGESNQLNPKEPPTPVATASQTRSKPEEPKKETSTSQLATPLNHETIKDTPNDGIQQTTSKAFGEASVASSLLNFFIPAQSKPTTAEPTKTVKEAPKSTSKVSETSVKKPAVKKARSAVSAKKTSSVSLKSMLSKKDKAKSKKKSKRVSFQGDEPPKINDTNPKTLVKQPKSDEPKTPVKSDKNVSEAKLNNSGATPSKPQASTKAPVTPQQKAGSLSSSSTTNQALPKTDTPVKTPSKMETPKSETLNKAPMVTQTPSIAAGVVKQPTQPNSDSGIKTKPSAAVVAKVPVKADRPVISRLNTKPDGRIIVNAPFDISQVIQLLIINDGPTHIAWSMKTTRPTHFEANPAFGILKPDSRVTAFVGFSGFVVGEEPKKTDRLTVLWTDVEEGTTFCRQLFEKNDIVTGKKLLPIEYNE